MPGYFGVILTKHHGKSPTSRLDSNDSHLYKGNPSVYTLISNQGKEKAMAHKKIERKKELQRRRKRREERLKQRIREAKAAKS